MNILIKNTLQISALIILMAGCVASKQNKQLSSSANSAFSQGDYEKALTSYESIIELQKSKNKEVDGAVYNKAGIAAWNLNQVEKSIDYLEKAKQLQGSNAQTYSTLALAYKKIDNLSKEITNLEYYTDKYIQGDEIMTVRRQLFDAYVLSENWELGEKLWLQLDSLSHNDIQSLTGYLRIERKLDRVDERDNLAKQLLKRDKNNIEALETMAEKYYYMADDSYVKEMKAYEKNHTMEQYNKLNAAFKKINQDYKTARDYFERLYKLKPDPDYAKFLGNIYTRFDNKQKASYYYKLANKK